MSILIWVRDKLFGSPKVETPVNPQITDAVTQTAPVVPAATATAKKKAPSTKRRTLKTKR